MNWAPAQQRTLMVGDTTHDVQMAQNAKVDVVAVGYGAHTPQQLRELNPACAGGGFC